MNMYGMQSTPPPMPPERSKLAQAAPGIGGILGGIAGAVIGTIICPGVGTMIGAGLGGSLGGGIGSLFKMGDDAKKSNMYNQQMGDYSQVRQQELQQYMQSMMMSSMGGLQMQGTMMPQMGGMQMMMPQMGMGF